MKQKSTSPLGNLHKDSIRKANEVPKAQKGFPNSTYSGPPVLHTPKDAPGTKKDKQ